MTHKNKVRLVIGAVIAVVVIPTAAFAAVLLFGFGTLNASATNTQNLTTSDSQLVGTLAPGKTVGAKTIAHNPNDFDVKVTDVYIQTEDLSATPAASCNATVAPKGTLGTYGTPIGQAYKIHLASPVTVDANGASWVDVPQAVSQDASGTTMCAVSAKFVLGAQVGN